MDVNDMPANLRQVIQEELEPNERYVWLAQPRPGAFAKKAIPVVIFGIPWTAFALFWTCGASGFQVPDFNQPGGWFALFGLPFVLIGLGMLSAPWWLLRAARRTAYAITDRRAILFEGGFGVKIRSFRAGQLGGVYRRQRADGWGDVILAESTSTDSEGYKRTNQVGFYGIPDVKAVESLLRQIVAQNQ
jgi:hypothetical protein